MKNIIYDKEDVKKILLHIKSILEKDETVTIVISDFVKAAEYGLAEGIEKDSYLGYLTYLYEDDEIQIYIEVDANGCDQFFIKDYCFKSENETKEILNMKFNKNKICYI